MLYWYCLACDKEVNRSHHWKRFWHYVYAPYKTSEDVPPNVVRSIVMLSNKVSPWYSRAHTWKRWRKA